MDNSSNIPIQYYDGVKDNKGITYTLQNAIISLTAKSMGVIIARYHKELKELHRIKELFAAGNADEKSILKQQHICEDLKKDLPAVTFSGTFTKRNQNNIIQHSGLICLDIDAEYIAGREKDEATGKWKAIKKKQIWDKGTWQAAWFNITGDAHTFLAFRSPSGNGIKLVFKIEADATKHKDYFASIEQYIKSKYNLVIDESGKDCSRLCFLSYDTNLFINHHAKQYELQNKITSTADADSNTNAERNNNTVGSNVTFNADNNSLQDNKNTLSEKDKKAAAKLSAPEKTQLQKIAQTCNDIFDSTQQYFDYTEGNRNAFVFKFSCNCSRVGIAEIEALQFAYGFATDLNPTEVKATVASAYKTTANEFAKFKRNEYKEQHQNTNGNSGKTGANNNKDNSTTNKNIVKSSGDKKDFIEPDFKFWKERKKETGSGDNRKEVVTGLELSRVDFCDFLFTKGFHLINTGDEGYQVVHSHDGIIKPVTPQQIKHFAINWCRSFFLKSVEEMLRKGQKNYFALNELDSLPYKEIELKRDTKEESFFFFNNCYVCVNNTGDITTHQYTQLQQYIWESKKIKFDFKPVKLSLYQTKKNTEGQEISYPLPAKEMNCEFARFVSYVSWNPHNEEEKYFSPELIQQRFECMCTAFGYMLDAYKHPALRKGVFAVDHKIGEKGEQNGRTGKSLFPKAWSLLRKVATINGKGFDPRYNFRYEPITIDSEIVNFNDMERGFDPECLFEVIADDYSVNRRNTGYIHMKYINSPKCYVSSNHVPKGDGSSYSGRMHIIEFSDYFNDRHSPYDEFGHGLFEDWNEEEKQRFFNFALLCVSMYKTGGLIDYPKANYDARKLVSEVVQEFVDFMDNTEYVPRNKPFVKIEVLATYNDKFHCPLGYKRLMPHTFSKWVRQYCKNKGYKFNPLQNGQYDKRNNVEYYTIADKDFKTEK